MASIVPHKNGYRAFVFVDGKRESALRRTKREAIEWADAREEELRNGPGAVTLEKAAEDWLAIYLPSLDNDENKRTVEQSIRDHVLNFKPPLKLGDAIPGPVALGSKSLIAILRTDLVACMKAMVDVGKVETAQRVGQRVCKIFDLAADSGLIAHGHPAANLARVLPRKRRQRRMPSVNAAELPCLLQAIDGYSEPITRMGLWLMAYTFTRTKELIGATHDEIMDPETWVIDPARVKRRLPHVVPLSRQARTILADLKAMRPDSDYFLPSEINPMCGISNNTLLFALYRLGYKGKMSGHGFRAVASTCLNGSKLWHADAIERQLAHRETDKVREAYNNAEYLDERRPMMQWWADHLDKLLVDYRTPRTAATMAS